MGELGWQVPRTVRAKTTQSPQRFPRYPNLVQGLALGRPDQVWVADLPYIHWRNGFVYLAVIMDVLTRTIRGWKLGQTLAQTLTLRPVPRALAQHTPETPHADQGVQYAATAYTQQLENAGVQLSMAEAGEAWQNGYAERLMRTMKEAEVPLSAYADYADVLRQVGRFLNEVYMHKRIPSALGYLTPAEFEEQWHQAPVQTLDVLSRTP